MAEVGEDAGEDDGVSSLEEELSKGGADMGPSSVEELATEAGNSRKAQSVFWIIPTVAAVWLSTSMWHQKMKTLLRPSWDLG